jgi:hypothetical protein
VCAVVNLVRQFGDTSRGLRIFLDLGLGVALTWATNYSMFSAWGIGFRSQWMAPAATGLVVGGIATFWHEALGFVGSYARRSYDEATAIEARLPKAA